MEKAAALTRVDKDRLDASHGMDSDDGMDGLDRLSSDVSTGSPRSVGLADSRVDGGETLEVGLQGRREGRVEGRTGREDGVSSNLGSGHELEGRLEEG